MAQPPPIPAASQPVPPALVKLPLVDPRTGIPTLTGGSFLTQLWAALAGQGGIYPAVTQLIAEVAIIFGMHGDGTLSPTGVLTVTKTQGVLFGPFATGTDAANLTGTIAEARLPEILVAAYTIATLPMPDAGRLALCTDLGGGQALVEADGVFWQRTTPGLETQAPVPALTLTVLKNAEEQYQSTVLAANMVVTLDDTGAYRGARFRWIRAGAGAFTLEFKDGGGSSLYISASGATETIECVSTGTAWVLAQHSLL